MPIALLLAAPSLLLGVLATPFAGPPPVPALAAPGSVHPGVGPEEEAEQVLLVRARRVIVRPGTVLENAAVLVQDGRIAAVGVGLEAPDGAKVLDTEVLCAGFIDPWSRLGVDPGSLSDRTTTASSSSVDALDPFLHELQRHQALRSGVTSVRVHIGRLGRIGGLGAFVRNLPESDLEQAVLVEDAALTTALGVQPGQDVFQRLEEVDRLIVELERGRRHREEALKYRDDLAAWQKAIAESEAELEREFRRAKRERDREIEQAKERGREFREKRYREDNKPRQPRFDPDGEVLARVVHGELPLIVEVDRAQELRALLARTEAYPRLRLVIAGATDARLFSEDLARRRIPVIVVPARRGQTAGFDHDELSLAADLAEAGVPLLLGSGGMDPDWVRELPLLAGIAVGRGLDPDAALAALTTLPARVLDLGHRLGSVERGKDADLLLLSGDPFAAGTRVERVLVAGRPVAP